MKNDTLAKTFLELLNQMQISQNESFNKLKILLKKNTQLKAKLVLSPVHVTKNCKIILTGLNDREVIMHALPKALYILFLRHNEGIRLKDMYMHKEELLHIYYKVTNKYNSDEIIQAIEDLVNVAKPSLNQKISRIRQSFREIFPEELALYYYPVGPKAGIKKILLPANKISIDCDI